VAIRDAVLILDVPTIEVHLSNIYKRESFRQRSFIADIATAQISGLGASGYLYALEALAQLID
jgi:3-dehydroquinate dehydratase-2